MSQHRPHAGTIRSSYAGLTAALAAVLALLPTTAFAASGGVRIIVQEWTAANPGVQHNDIVLDRPGLLGDALGQGWTQGRKAVCDAITAEAGRPDRLARGFSLYDMDCSMGQTGTLAVTALSGQRVSMIFTVPGNRFKAKSTQPTVAGSYADPCFFLSYDLSAKTTLNLDTLAVDAFNVGIDNVSRPDSCNTAGDIAKFASTALHFFGGPDFLAIAQQALTRTQDVTTAPLNAAVRSFVDPLHKYTAQYATRENWVRHGDLYFAFAPAYVPQPLSAGMGGAIRMAKTATGPPNCNVFSIVGSVQTGPAPITNPEQMLVGAAPSVNVGTISTTGNATETGGSYVCAYTERELPAGVPIAFRGAGNVAAIHNGHVTYAVGLRPDGWSGTESITGFASAKNFVASVSPELTGFAEQRLGTKLDPGDPARGSPTSRISTLELNPQPLPPRLSDPLVVSGNALFARGDFAGAATAYQRAFNANAGNAIALHNLGLAHARQGQSEVAKGELKRASDLARTQGDLATSQASERAIIIVGGRH